ncbi:MAG: aminopeptidase [Fervidobacterium sp.]|uniref:M18 family aminopeptidase n=1 Tax=Fervidobacterium gondwanense DSM 13020 TaxID=1121883 RepID=A0A1M7SBR1_FERGO|nr:aminopeptidase [Fervidobacterium gondwanense]UXF00417.1 aminopeptidase 1 [Fervidobacterium riparium]SHN55682.1 Aspartyl aminopeptidase [Fervidobacterium gondwanense DSM 13020]
MGMNELVWKKRTREEIEHFSDDYKRFIEFAKTERLAIEYFEKLLQQNGFVSMEETASNFDKVFYINRGKSLVAIKGDISKGVNFIAAHVDAPRIDLRTYPLYEDSSIALAKTHYYGGVKKYQWFSLPLALVGVVVKESGEKIDVCIGCDEKDPVLVIPDLLPHLDKEDKKVSEQFRADKMNVILGSIPLDGEEKEPVKKYVLKLLKEKYNIDDEDFVSADLELVPALKPRDVGIDASFVGAYGHDDRICAYQAVMALLAAEPKEKALGVILFDREEIGSEGDSGAQARFYKAFLRKLLVLKGVRDTESALDDVIKNSTVLSADVTTLFDPSFPDVHDKLNVAKAGYGVALVKYTGRGGKGGASEAHAELVARVRGILNKNGISWQVSLLGKVDVGGGGTVAKFLAQEGFNTIDIGPGLMSMHAPFELVSKADLYETYLAFKVLIEEL